jgi:hypothetical protein
VVDADAAHAGLADPGQGDDGGKGQRHDGQHQHRREQIGAGARSDPLAHRLLPHQAEDDGREGRQGEAGHHQWQEQERPHEDDERPHVGLEHQIGDEAQGVAQDGERRDPAGQHRLAGGQRSARDRG